jgi:hypothetical protein
MIFVKQLILHDGSFRVVNEVKIGREEFLDIEFSFVPHKPLRSSQVCPFPEGLSSRWAFAFQRIAQKASKRIVITNCRLGHLAGRIAEKGLREHHGIPTQIRHPFRQPSYQLFLKLKQERRI